MDVALPFAQWKSLVLVALKLQVLLQLYYALSKED
jgi:hypothetical protein